MDNAHDGKNEATIKVRVNRQIRRMIEEMAEENNRDMSWAIREIIWAYMRVSQKAKVA